MKNSPPPTVAQPSPETQDRPVINANAIAVKITAYAPAAEVIRGRLDAFELVWPVTGSAYWLGDWGLKHLLTRGDVALLRCGGRAGMATTGEMCQLLSVRFELEHLPATWPAVDRWPVVRRMESGDLCRELLCFLLTLSRREANDAIRAEFTRRVLELLLGVYVTGTAAINAPPIWPMPTVVQKALGYIRDQLGKYPNRPITTEQIAEAVGLSRARLYELFTEHVKSTVHGEIRRARLDRAVELLYASPYPVETIAHFTGFSTRQKLQQLVMEEFGMSAIKLRVRLQSGDVPMPALRSPLLAGSALDPAQLKVLDDEPAVDELDEEADESAPKYEIMEENQTQRCGDVAAMMLEGGIPGGSKRGVVG